MLQEVLDVAPNDWLSRAGSVTHQFLLVCSQVIVGQGLLHRLRENATDNVLLFCVKRGIRAVCVSRVGGAVIDGAGMMPKKLYAPVPRPRRHDNGGESVAHAVVLERVNYACKLNPSECYPSDRG